MKVQTVTPYRVSYLQRYGVTVRGNVTNVYPTLECKNWIVEEILKPEVTRRVGELKLRLFESVGEDLNNMGVRNLRRK
jgi:hypothetical protein